MFEQQPAATAPRDARSRAWLWLIVINAAIYFGERLFGRGGGNLWDRFHLLPSEVFAGQVWQLVTYQFLHVNATHLAMNCLGLYFFGQPVGEHYGDRAVWRIYLFCGVMGGLAHCLLGWIYPGWYGRIAVVGASAGVYGMVGAFCWAFWSERFRLCLPFTRWGLPFSGQRLFVLFLVVGVFSMLDLKSGVAHDAHLGGMFAGLLLAQSRLRAKSGSARQKEADDVAVR